jgi:hypothetical protein
MIYKLGAIVVLLTFHSKYGAVSFLNNDVVTLKLDLVKISKKQIKALIHPLKAIVLLLTFHSNNGAVSNLKKKLGNYQIIFGNEKQKETKYLDDLQVEGNCFITDLSLK